MIEAESRSHQALPCPHCGYDTTGLTHDRCPECGGEIDHAWIQWLILNRRQMGWAKAMLIAAGATLAPLCFLLLEFVTGEPDLIVLCFLTALGCSAISAAVLTMLAFVPRLEARGARPLAASTQIGIGLVTFLLHLGIIYLLMNVMVFFHYRFGGRLPFDH